MNDHDFETSFRAWSASEASDSASDDLRGRVGAIPSTTPQQRGWLPPVPTGRFQSMFSATKFVVAGVIVALFGGFLLAGVLTQQREDVVPAAATASSTPMTTDDLLSRVATEEVAPGVLRVIGDGTTHEFSDGSIENVAFGPDGAIWMVGDGIGDGIGLFQVGEPGFYPGRYSASLHSDLTIGPDGTPWATHLTSLSSFTDGKWSRVPLPIKVSALEVLPDGTVWARGTTALARLAGDEVTTYSFAEAPIQLSDEDQYAFPGDLATTPDGNVWVAFSSGRGDRP